MDVCRWFGIIGMLAMGFGGLYFVGRLICEEIPRQRTLRQMESRVRAMRAALEAGHAIDRRDLAVLMELYESLTR